jgi:hypothetical protein
MDAIYNNMGTRVPGMFKKGGAAPKGYHFMPDGTLMKDSDHMKKGGSTTKKDSCYYKAKKAHKVFPSAYASGMIAKCRKNKARK